MNLQNNKKHKLGKIGEKLVADLFNLKESVDPFDVECDLRDDQGKTYEVKTQVRHPFKGCFTVNTAHMTNLQKCLNVDHLIFVEYNTDDVIRIWECTNREIDDIFKTRDGRTMAGWKINKMKLLKELEDSNLAFQMKSFSSSTFIR